MNNIRLTNLRCLEDTGSIELKPLTFLVGKNSSGKSTFLRFFPLMKQTLETRTNEPILWYSSRYVDFGSFEESVNYQNKANIGFECEFDLTRKFLELDPIFSHRATTKNSLKSKLNLKISVECKEKYIEKIVIVIEDHRIELLMKSREKVARLTINNEEIDDKQLILDYLKESTSMLPRISISMGEKILNAEHYFQEILVSLLKEKAHSLTKNETIEKFIEGIEFGGSTDILKSIKSQNTSANLLKDNLKQVKINDAYFKEMKKNLLGSYINKILSVCNRYLEINFTTVNYIAPLRASAERYYRIQGLSVDEIDPQGVNIPMILHNMSDKEKTEFEEWVYSKFDFEIISVLEGGHTSLKIKYKNSSEEINLADTGFGNSQILPIILVLWQSIRRNTDRKTLVYNNRIYKLTGFRALFTIVIEQPELHLHPALQAKLIDTFVQIIESAKERNIDLKIIVETHSETMINRIGYLIAKKLYGINHDFVNVLIFDKEKNYKSIVSTTSYSEKGYLNSWPIGFFNPEDI